VRPDLEAVNIGSLAVAVVEQTLQVLVLAVDLVDRMLVVVMVEVVILLLVFLVDLDWQILVLVVAVLVDMKHMFLVVQEDLVLLSLRILHKYLKTHNNGSTRLSH